MVGDTGLLWMLLACHARILRFWTWAGFEVKVRIFWEAGGKTRSFFPQINSHNSGSLHNFEFEWRWYIQNASGTERYCVNSCFRPLFLAHDDFVWCFAKNWPVLLRREHECTKIWPCIVWAYLISSNNAFWMKWFDLIVAEIKPANGLDTICVQLYPPVVLELVCTSCIQWRFDHGLMADNVRSQNEIDRGKLYQWCA